MSGGILFVKKIHEEVEEEIAKGSRSIDIMKLPIVRARLGALKDVK